MIYSLLYSRIINKMFLTNHTDFRSILQLSGHWYSRYNFQIIKKFTVCLGCIDLCKNGKNTGITNWFDLLFIFQTENETPINLM